MQYEVIGSVWTKDGVYLTGQPDAPSNPLVEMEESEAARLVEANNLRAVVKPVPQSDPTKKGKKHEDKS